MKGSAAVIYDLFQNSFLLPLVFKVKMAFFTPVLSEIIRQLVLGYFPLTSEVSVIFKNSFPFAIISI